MIVDPWGKVISSATNKKGIIYASVDRTLVKKSRKNSVNDFFSLKWQIEPCIQYYSLGKILSYDILILKVQIF